jgi:3-oxoacyl-[acyl-carrier-protein] synthase II
VRNIVGPKKIVVTGIGATTPLAGNAPDTWKALLAGESGARSFEHEWVEKYEIPVTFAAEALVRPSEVLERVELKRLDPSAQFALIAAREAWADAGIEDFDPDRLLVDWATGIGGVWTLLDAWDTLRERGPRRVLPMTVPMIMPNSPAAAVSMNLNARAGARTVVSACASSTESLVNAYDHLQQGYADIVVAGGSESCIHPITVSSFASMQALSKRNDDPARASRPYDKDRDGFVMGEGAAALVLETEEHAKARGAKIYAEVAGGGITSDAYHITAPSAEGGVRASRIALEQAGLSPRDIVHVNAHATSTGVGDVSEASVIRTVFGDHADNLAVTATKASTGHLLGGTGALEAIFTVLALKERVAPPTINLDNLDPEIDLDVVTEPRQLPEGDIAAVSNSLGFGGHNAVVAFRSV